MNKTYKVVIEDQSMIEMFVPAADDKDAMDTAGKIHMDARCGDGECGPVTLRVVSVASIDEEEFERGSQQEEKH